MIIEESRYRVCENDAYRILISGVLIGTEDDYFRIAREMENGTLDFNGVEGWFKILVQCKENDTWYFWGDNQGSQNFFFDEHTAEISDSFLKLLEKRTERVPNYVAVAETIRDGTVFGEDTLVLGIKKTDYLCFYVCDGKTVVSHSKKLQSFFEPTKRYLDDVFTPLLDTIKAQNLTVGAVCTGGTDSRLVLACLKYYGILPPLFITGHAGNPDVPIAKEVAQALGAELTVIDPTTYPPKWIETGFVFQDGMDDAVLGYRHYVRSQWNIEHHIDVEFGGMGGEFFKNTMYHRAKRIGVKRYTTNMRACSAPWCGKKVEEAAEGASKKRLARLEEMDTTDNFLQKSNFMAYDLDIWETNRFTNAISKISYGIDPLMDRKLIAAISVENPRTLEMQAWHRKQIKKHCPELNNIVTTTGKTCSADTRAMVREMVLGQMREVKRLSHRLLEKMHLTKKSVSPQFWNIDYFTAREDPIWERAVQVCKELGIVAPEIDSDSIPLNMTGCIIQLGLIFKKRP